MADMWCARAPLGSKLDAILDKIFMLRPEAPIAACSSNGHANGVILIVNAVASENRATGSGLMDQKQLSLVSSFLGMP
jgi:hypothetical protein